MGKTDALNEISEFFFREHFTPEETKRIKALAMKHGIKLGEHRKRFCKSCLSQLRGTVKVGADHKTVTCAICGNKNRFKIN